ncbi:MAG: mechanosensitive ion channel domain-containing protein [Planctomycetota bacterium]|nr:mechanosensitive ion channel domain-containing protein [Planctomycetota bacterium]
MISHAMTTTSLLLSPQGSSQPQNPLDKAVSQAAESSAERWLPNLDLWIEQAIGVAALIVIGVLILLATRALRMLVIRPLIQRTKNKWDDVFVDQAFFRWISYMPPTLICSAIVEQMPGLDPSFASAQPIDLWIHQILTAATTLTGMLAVGAIVDACHELWRRNSKNRGRSIKGYISLIKLFVYILGTVAAVAFLFGRDPTGLLAGLGAMTAVLLLVFKDTILSLVASITLTQNDMIRLGDWIEVPGAADGDVVDMALHTVKIQNFDRTISTIPTIQLVDRPFKNWRNMSDGPGRRIKRSLFLDSASVRFLTEEEVARFGEIALLKDYIGGKQQDLAATNKACDPAAAPLDVRRLTNLGTFRAYVYAWLRQHPQIHQGLTLLVRQLSPGPKGLPMELYAFTKTTAWGEYEDIQADVFDFLLAAVHEFDLRLFQGPTGEDLRAIRAGGSPRA